MELTLKITFTIILLIIAYQDFNYRAVSWILFPIALAIQICIALLSGNTWVLFHYFLINLTILAVQLLVLIGYLLLKNKTKQNNKLKMVGSYLGLGDVLFFVVVASAFSPFNFVLAMLAMFVLALLLSVFIVRKTYTIPLAGIMALAFIPMQGLNYFFTNFNPYIDILTLIQ